jgi:transcriptional regulator with XRE-family HTH domain
MATAILVTPFSEWLTARMKARGMNKSAVAKMAGGVTPSTVGRWVNKDARPSADVCVRLADYFKVPAADVLRLAGYPAPEPSDSADIPQWLADLLPLLSELSEAEAPAIEHSARAALEMRELRAKYGVQE